VQPIVRAAYPADRAAVAQARRFVRETLLALGADDAIDDAVLLTSELATNAVTHAGTPFEVICRAADTSVQVEVVDGAPGRVLPAPGRGGDPDRISGRGLLMPVMLAAAWGVSYAADSKTVWFRLCTQASPAPSGTPVPTVAQPACADRLHQGWLSFLAEASELLAGTLDEAMLVALAAQIVVPRLARWCAFYRADDLGYTELAHVWHTDERRIGTLRELLAKAAPPLAEGGVRPWTGLSELPAGRLREVGGCGAVAMPVRARWRSLGTLVLGRADGGPFPQEMLWMVEDLGHRIAIGLDNARMYSRQQAVSQALQHSLLPYAVPDIPGVEHSVVYRPAGEGYDVGGDFYDVFEAGPGRWRFAIGDVCGTGPEAAAVTGLARHALRLLAGEGHGVADVITRLNQAILEEGARGRLMTLLHGELVRPPGGGVRLTLVSAGHPLPLRLSPSGEVTAAAGAQLLLGAVGGAEFEEDTVDLGPGDVLLCVTDGVTERRGDGRLLDDDDGLARLLAGWTHLSAGAVAERLWQAVEAFAPDPGSDDLAMLVLRVL
jgi:serine phosphatase RsbU (regulator of sigma subunit)/anti-sigma regulatory factor (Ser/Thr protein kinase)